MLTVETRTKEEALIACLEEAHDESARRANMSTQALQLAAAGSGDYFKSIAAALMTLGGVHGPLRQTQELLQAASPVEAANRLLDAGEKVPGWGNSFVRGQHDPLWDGVRRCLIDGWPDLWERIESVSRVLHARHKPVHPNPSAYTAACAIALGIPPETCGVLFISGRLRAWTDLYLAALGKGT